MASLPDKLKLWQFELYAFIAINKKISLIFFIVYSELIRYKGSEYLYNNLTSVQFISFHVTINVDLAVKVLNFSDGAIGATVITTALNWL